MPLNKETKPTKPIPVYKQLNCKLLKNEIINQIFHLKWNMYIHLNVREQMIKSK